jgi:hypothetical protein
MPSDLAIHMPPYYSLITGTLGDEMDQLIVAAALEWWVQFRPTGWTMQQHLEQPTVNCTTPKDADLARAVATFLDALTPHA